MTATSGTLAGSPVTFTATATAGSATRLAIATQPSATVQSGIAFLQQPVIQLQDASGNPVSQAGVTVGVKIQSGGGTLGGTTSATTGATGQAVFTNLSIAGSVGPRTLRFGAAGVDSVTSATLNVTAGAATQIALNAGDGQSATTGTAVASPPSVIVRDASNNPVQGVGVTFAVATGGGSITAADQTTNASGIATVGSWTLGTTAGSNTLTASAAGLTGSPVAFTATGTAGPAATLAKFSGDNQVGQVGTTLATPQTVLVTDAHGNPVNNVTITWAAASGGGSVNPTSSVTAAPGHASTTRTLGPTPGTQTTTASATGLTPVTFSVTAQVGGATQMVISGGQQQTDTVGQTLPVPLSVRVADALNNPVAGVTISWSVLDGGGSVNPLTSTTNTSGIASTNWTLGTTMTPTDSTQTAQATGVGSALSFTAFTVPGAVSPTQTSVVAAPATITASSGAGPSTITVTARDQYGNVIKNKTVTLAVSGSNNTLTQPSGPTGTNGVATGTLSSTLAQTKTVSATVGTVAIAQQATVTVAPAAADTLAWLVQPGNVAAGAHITPALQVEVRDQFGNRVTAATAGITLAIGTNPSGGALTVTPRNAVSGVATFDDASIDKAGSGYTLVASSGGLGPVTSNSFNVTAAAASSIAPSAGGSQTGTVGTPVQTPPAVIVRDQFNNPVAGVAVTFTPAAGSGSVSPTTPVLTNASGVAALTSWTLGTTAGANTLTASSNGLAGSPVTFTAQGAAGPATQIALNAGNGQAAPVGTAVATPPAVIVRDQFANPVAGVAVTFATSGDNGTVDPATAVTTGANGIAAANSWTLGTAAKVDTLRATAAGLSGSPVTFTATASAGGPSAAQSTVVAAPAAITAGAGPGTLPGNRGGAGGDHGGRGLEHHHGDRAGRQRESDPGRHGDARGHAGWGEHSHAARGNDRRERADHRVAELDRGGNETADGHGERHADRYPDRDRDGEPRRRERHSVARGGVARDDHRELGLERQHDHRHGQRPQRQPGERGHGDARGEPRHWHHADAASRDHQHERPDHRRLELDRGGDEDRDGHSERHGDARGEGGRHGQPAPAFPHRPPRRQRAERAGRHGRSDPAVRDRHRCVRQSRVRGVGDLRGGRWERQRHGIRPDDRCERDRGRGKLDAFHYRGSQYADGHVAGARGQPGDVHGDRHRRAGGADRGQRGEQSDCHRGQRRPDRSFGHRARPVQ